MISGEQRFHKPSGPRDGCEGASPAAGHSGRPLGGAQGAPTERPRAAASVGTHSIIDHE